VKPSPGATLDAGALASGNVTGFGTPPVIPEHAGRRAGEDRGQLGVVALAHVAHAGMRLR
jgi:hypothetical protein